MPPVRIRAVRRGLWRRRHVCYKVLSPELQMINSSEVIRVRWRCGFVTEVVAWLMDFVAGGREREQVNSRGVYLPANCLRLLQILKRMNAGYSQSKPGSYSREVRRDMEMCCRCERCWRVSPSDQCFSVPALKSHISRIMAAITAIGKQQVYLLVQA